MGGYTFYRFELNSGTQELNCLFSMWFYVSGMTQEGQGTVYTINPSSHTVVQDSARRIRRQTHLNNLDHFNFEFGRPITLGPFH